MIEETTGTGGRQSTFFDRALDEYIESLPKDKKQLKFIELCRESDTFSPEAINSLIQKEEAKHSLSGPVKRLFHRIVLALQDYNEVIGQMVSAQPLPLAIVWGALKLVIESAARCRGMVDSMKEELRTLEDQIRRLTDFEDLYGNSETMRQYLFQSYTNMIRFWHRVHKECDRSRVSNVSRSLTSSSQRKLNAIIADLKNDVQSISQEAALCQAKLDNQEYAESQKERKSAAQERKMQSEWREKQNDHNYLDLWAKIRTSLLPVDAENANTRRHEANIHHRFPGTCDWLSEDEIYTKWTDVDVTSSSSTDPLLCLSAPPGYGKSILTSSAIQHSIQRGVAVAYYYCQFSQPCASQHELLRLLAFQLFNTYFARKLPVHNDVCHQVISSSTSQDIQTLILELIKSLAPVHFFIDGLDEAQDASGSHVSSVLNFLRESCDSLHGMSRLWCTKRRQMRIVGCYENAIQPFPHLSLEIADHTEADVVRFLRAKFASLETRLTAQLIDGLEETDRKYLHFAENYLVSRAKGNFLWARLMTQNFDGEDRIESVKDLMDAVIESPPPEELDKLYTTIFWRINQKNRKTAAKVISLVAFARRHLRIEELREATSLLTTRGKKNASDGGIMNMAPAAFLSQYTALVEFDAGDATSGSAGSCRLVHSSVLEFLVNKPAVLGEDRALLISKFPIADACLLYLSRPIYSSLLQKRCLNGRLVWADSAGRSTDDRHHSLAQYSAKDWAQHLDSEQIDQPQLLQKRVASFVESTNFATCIQMQMIWVEGKFTVYSVGGRPSLLRALPDWFIHPPNQPTDISKHWSDYGTLLHDWRRFLSCGDCDDSDGDCSLVLFRGEVDRLWWGSLDPSHLFVRFPSRYVTFRLDDASNGTITPKGHLFEAMHVADASQFMTLRLREWDRDSHTLEFTCETWSGDESMTKPSLKAKHIIKTNEAASNWALFGKTHGHDHLVARATSFSEDGALLRIGCQVFVLNQDSIDGPLLHDQKDHQTGKLPSYYEEFASHGQFIAFGCRAFTAAEQLQSGNQIIENFGEDFARFEQWISSGKADARGSDDETDDEQELDCLSDSSSEAELDSAMGYESWSEGSTVYDEDYDSGLDDDLYSNPASEPDSDDETGASDSSSSGSGSESGATEEEDSSDSDEAPEEPKDDAVEAETERSEDSSSRPPSVLFGSSRSASPVFGYFAQDSDDEGAIWNTLVDASLGTFAHGRPDIRHGESQPTDNLEPEIAFSIFQRTDDGHVGKIFHYTHPLSSMLYASPPAFHPTKPLVAWPLGAGEVLFADYQAKTYFVRKLRASAPRTRHLSMKLKFSSCGNYLHIASLEAQIGGTKRRSHRLRPELRIYVLLSTYRLSARKTTRSPPSLIHRVKVELGEFDGLNVLQLPFTLTWTERNLFVTQSACELRVMRIALFRDTNSCSPIPAEHNVVVPKTRTFLPDTANERDVHFVPSVDGKGGCVLVGSKARARGRDTSIQRQLRRSKDTVMRAAADIMDQVLGTDAKKREILTPPIGCFLKEEDLGGWVRHDEVPVAKGEGAGKFDRRREKFDPVDDCDVEPYLQYV